MAYEINRAPYQGQLVSGERGRPGRKPRYPFTEMAVGEWIAIPFEERMWVFGAARYAKRQYGVQMQITQEAETWRWICMRVG